MILIFLLFFVKLIERELGVEQGVEAVWETDGFANGTSLNPGKAEWDLLSLVFQVHLRTIIVLI